jgi:hypothetical protein
MAHPRDVYFVSRQLFDQLHGPFLGEAGNFRPHDFGALFLTDETLQIVQRLENHRAGGIVVGGDPGYLSYRWFGGKL